MNISQRLRTCARHTGLDAVIELLQEAADEIDRLSAGRQAEAQQPACGCREGTCESKPAGCRMAAEVARCDPKAM